MAPLRGWGPKGKRLRGLAPHGHWRTLTFLGALRCDRLAAPCVFDGPINGQCFRAYVEQQLITVLKPGDIVVMDMCGRPRWCKRIFRRARSVVGADMCPASVAAVTCRGPVWEFAERVQNNLARSRRVSMIWFSRSRLVDRGAILSFGPSHTFKPSSDIIPLPPGPYKFPLSPSTPTRCAPSCWPGRRSPAWAACAQASARAKDPPSIPSAWPSARRRSPR